MTVARVACYVEGITGRQFIARVRIWARGRGIVAHWPYWPASEGPGSHGTLYAGNRKTTVKDRKKVLGKGLLAKMLADLGIERYDFEVAERTKRP